MLTLFQSNRMTSLADAFCERQGSNPDPFEPTTVIVQSFGLGQWLKLRTATRDGIAANLECILPATFLWELYRQLVPGAERLAESPFSRERLTWHIMRIFSDRPDLSATVTRYLEQPGDQDLRRYQLASEVAGLLDEYLMYRPEWILQWERNQELPGHAGWQSALWREVLAGSGDFRTLHRAALHQQTLQALEQPFNHWPRLSLFGLSTMPPLQLQTFEAMAQHIDIDIFFLNPCEHYWGDIVSPRDKARRSIRQLIDRTGTLLDEDYVEVGNPLLSSLGKQGREYLELLLESNNLHTAEHFESPGTDSMLHHVQGDILDLTWGGQFGTDTQPDPINMQDASLQVHVCHSRLREVEVLHDEILRALNSEDNLQPHDIIVMCPDVSAYAPFIQSVFTGSLPFRTADTTRPGDNTLIDSVLTLLSLPGSRITAPEIMDLLEVPAIMRRFEFNQEDLETLAYWIDASGIRWEINGDTRSTYWDIDNSEENTWQFGLNRLLLGFAMTGENGAWSDILPFEVAPADVDLLGRLCRIIELIGSWRTLLAQRHPAQNWQQHMSRLVADFYEPRGDEVLDVDRLLASAAKLSDHASAGGYRDSLSWQLIVDYMTTSLAEPDSRAGFITGGITFATLVPMRSIPFRMVCLMGMNDSEYPREQRPHSFDLIADGDHRRGDRSRPMDDRYLFLEALLSAEETFYVSYVGKGARDNKDRPPSVVVGEWINYLTDVFTNFKPVIHSLQPFNARYYQGDERHSFDTTWFDALRESGTPAPFCPAPLAVDETYACSSLQQLRVFLRHPARYFMEQRLGIYLDVRDVALRETETFEPGALERYQLADQALQHLIRHEPLEELRSRILQSGLLTRSALGQRQVQREFDRAGSVYSAAEPYLAGDDTPLKGEVLLQDGSILVDLPHCSDNRLLVFRVGRLDARQLLASWTDHLGACALGHAVETLSITWNAQSGKAEISTLLPLSTDESRAQLQALVDLYHQGMCEPVFLPPGAAREYAIAMSRDDDTDRALRQVRQSWQSDNPGAESQDRYWQRFFDPLNSFSPDFQAQALAVWLPILEAGK